MADNKGISLGEFSDELNAIFNDFLHQSYEVRQKAVQKGAEKFVEILTPQTPVDTGEMARSWKIKDKIPNHRYVGNTKTAKGVVHRKGKGGKKGEARSGVPLVNVLEYGANSPHKGFFTGAFDSAQTEIFNAIKSEFTK